MKCRNLNARYNPMIRLIRKSNCTSYFPFLDDNILFALLYPDLRFLLSCCPLVHTFLLRFVYSTLLQVIRHFFFFVLVGQR